MFLFSPGFEAATLKIPSPDEEVGGRKQIVRIPLLFVLIGTPDSPPPSADRLCKVPYEA